MWRQNHAQALQELHIAYLRFADERYHQAVAKLPQIWKKTNLWGDLEYEFSLYSFRLMARLMQECKYRCFH
jgi:hypothetical protein